MASPPAPRRRAPDVFTVLVRAYTPLVRLAAWQAGAPEADLADVAQEVFLRLAQAMTEGLDVSAPLHGWLRRTTYTVTRDRRKLASNAREKVSATGEVDLEHVAPNAEDSMVIDELHRLVKATLDELPQNQREVLVMSDMGDMPMSEISADLGIPLGTGYSRLRAARTAFAEKLHEKQARGEMAVMPFALWGARDVIAAARNPPPAPPGFEDVVVARVAAALAVGLGGPAAAAVAAAGAAKTGLVLSAAQIAGGIVAAMIAGAAIHAAFVAPRDRGTDPATAVSAVAVHDRASALDPVATATASATVAQVTTTAPTGTASAADDAKRAAAQGVEVDERKLMLNARGAIERGDPGAALALLARVKNPRYVDEREELRRLARAAQDGGR